MSDYVNEVINVVEKHHADQPEFVRTVKKVLNSLAKVIDRHPEFEQAQVLERLVEPENIEEFDVVWTDDAGAEHINKGYRVQFNSAIGPYKGGTRFHPTVNLDILKSLAFEQIFKNSLTTLDMGGGKGGSDFDPHGKSDAEVERFAKAYMKQLYPCLVPKKDYPAGDIGVGAREIKAMLEEYKQLSGGDISALTGKSVEDGGSYCRKQATGYGLVYFVREFLESEGQSLQGKKVLISGSGNVATYAAEKCTQLGAKVLTMSDSSGFVLDENGIDVEVVKQIKEVERGRIKEYVDRVSGAKYFESERPWSVSAEIALPCATQNEVDVEDAKKLAANDIKIVAEGANLPVSPDAIVLLRENGVVYLPGKAANAGGVAVSGLEMIQNKQGVQWPFEEVDAKLQGIMKTIFKNLSEANVEYDLGGNYMDAANVVGFLCVGKAMLN